MLNYVPAGVNKHYVLRRMTINDVKEDTPQSQLQAIAYGFSMVSLGNQVRTYFPHWEWKARQQSLFGGYWVDPTLIGEREGESYLITLASEQDELVKAVWIAYAWHNSDILYGFAILGGIILDEENRNDLHRLVMSLLQKEELQAGNLRILLNYIDTVPVLGQRPQS